MKLRPADEEGRDDVVPMPVEVVPSPVVVRRRPGVGAIDWLGNGIVSAILATAQEH